MVIKSFSIEVEKVWLTYGQCWNWWVTKIDGFTNTSTSKVFTSEEEAIKYAREYIA